MAAWGQDPVAMGWTGTNTQLLALARRGDTGAVAAAIYDLFEADVNRLVWRILGADAEHDDVVHHVFIQLVTGIAKLRDPEALRVWMGSVCVKTVRTEIRRRRLRRLFAASPSHRPHVAAPSQDHEARELLEKTYAILDSLPANQRLAFVLRHLEELALVDVAAACNCSLATIKRRLAKAETRFKRLAAREPGLAERLGEGRRWAAGSGVMSKGSP
jgi:RNA polymerase sigma-70 factor (ECF subfamily)